MKVLFYTSAKEEGEHSMGYMWLDIVLSFGFYIPVVLLADTIPVAGVLMIPKTHAYVWIAAMRFCEMKRSVKL